jgi:hypothetical protein
MKEAVEDPSFDDCPDIKLFAGVTQTIFDQRYICNFIRPGVGSGLKPILRGGGYRHE